MTRNAIILVFVCALAGALFHIWTSEDLPPQQNASRIEEVQGEMIEETAVYATQKIERGSVVRNNWLEERVVEFSKDLPVGTIGKIWYASGRIARHQIDKGNVVRVGDLESFRNELVVRAKKDIPQGAYITEDSVEAVPRDSVTILSQRPFADSFSNKSFVIGKRARFDIGMRQIINASLVKF